VLRGVAVLVLLTLCLAACGGGSKSSSGTQVCPNQQRALAKINREIAAIRQAAKLPTKDTLKGNHAINVATDRFLNDVELAPLTNLQRNRLIDHAMAALVGTCQQCFQAFEAARPIPSIRAGDLKCSK
jgi:hypothetical protein